jgi:hypothetical protein
MQQRAGLLFLAKSTGRILLIYENARWTVPTFFKKSVLLSDAKQILEDYAYGKILPIELYLSEDRGFEYGTYVCLVEEEFLTDAAKTISWSDRYDLPKNIHTGLKTTLYNQTTRIKLETILELENADSGK